jgi:hypothetical protein
MDSPPSNYNPNDSMLNGGTESIMKVMGGGGTSPPINNYDETQSILSGGIEQIQRVEGGGNENPENETDISVRYIVNYDFEDDEAKEIYSRFIQTLGSQEKIQNLNQAYTREIQRLEDDNKPLHYVSKPSFVVYRNSSTNTKVSRTTIKFIPKSAREIIVLPPVNGNVEVFFKQILFLRDSNYLQITRDKKFKLSTNIYVISLEPFSSSVLGVIEERGKTDAELKEEAQKVSKEKEQTEEKKVDTNIANLFNGGAIQSEILLNHLYLKFKKDNFYSFFLTNSPYTIIYPRQISDKNGIFFTSGVKKEFSQPKDSNDLQPIDADTIIEKNINMMTYVNGEEKYGDNEFFVIKSGDNDPNINNTQLSFDINKYITILDLIDTEIPSTVIDINGIYYKIRMANNQGASDSVYKSWYDRKFTKQEKKLVNDLNILDMLKYKYSNASESDQSLINKEIADFLYYLTYYKCFKDISVLTKRECEITRGFLKELYKYNLIIKSRKIEGVKRDDITVRCSAVDIRSESIICDIIYKKNKRRRVDKVKIKKPENFNLNPEITEEIEQNALNVWRNSKKTSV